MNIKLSEFSDRTICDSKNLASMLVKNTSTCKHTIYAPDKNVSKFLSFHSKLHIYRDKNLPHNAV